MDDNSNVPISPGSNAGHRHERPDPPEPPVSWPLVVGLGSLALLWPLAELTHVSAALGEAATALVLLLLVAVLWIGGVGMFRVPRPVLTLTLAGVVYGLFLMVLRLVFGGPGFSPPIFVVASVIEVGRSAVLGAFAGVAASGVQRLLGRRA
ncbi:MAG: hypothetical protein DIU71_19315 [Proteobacteria bacterium]|jgi:hypothetical protein|uniref:hypothetical protein n=1 Tax=Thermasporomyces composti TaxID=696763 RepID=UPI000DB29777|nr:hypothetical protein [Thermasporomyces composti]PZN25754.1 MAG: hypothetical protein DIU71_19315 [Pseudomonadota bacterium]